MTCKKKCCYRRNNGGMKIHMEKTMEDKEEQCNACSKESEMFEDEVWDVWVCVWIVSKIMVMWVNFDFDSFLYVWIIFKIMVELWCIKIMIELKQGGIISTSTKINFIKKK